MAIVFVLMMARPDIYGLLTLDPSLALKQPWRFVTYLFLPQDTSLIWVLFTLYWTWLVGTNLEHEWGPFKFNVYYLFGAIGTTAAAWITRQPQTNIWLNTSLFFAFATIFPNFEIRLFFIIPIKVKWLALITLGYVALQFFTGPLGVKVAIGVAFTNYLIFFAGHLVSLARGQQLQMKQAARRTSLRASERTEREESEGRVCAICQKRQADGADIRVCSCEKCGGPRELCLEHARNH
jgi:membrane associated rhomboid family serine protease